MIKRRIITLIVVCIVFAGIASLIIFNTQFEFDIDIETTGVFLRPGEDTQHDMRQVRITGTLLRHLFSDGRTDGVFRGKIEIEGFPLLTLNPYTVLIPYNAGFNVRPLFLRTRSQEPGLPDTISLRNLGVIEFRNGLQEFAIKLYEYENGENDSARWSEENGLVFVAPPKSLNEASDIFEELFTSVIYFN